jgi:hypothetical protein
MAVEMIGGPRLCEPLLATGLGRFTGAATRHANGPRKNISPLAKGLGFRRIATRYDKLARNYFSALCLVAAVAFWL